MCEVQVLYGSENGKLKRVKVVKWKLLHFGATEEC